MQSSSSIVIAGGGFCGTMTLVHLLKNAQRPLKITLFNKHHPVARGVAYQTYSGLHLLNVEARNMSAFPDQPDHFVNWCLSHPDKHSYNATDLPTSFVARNLYGHYLDSVLQNALHAAPEFVDVKLHDEEVKDIDISGTSIHVKTETGREFKTDKVVLATGNHLPGNPPIPNQKIFSGKNYFSNPWVEQSVAGLNENGTVLIIGTGLTMVDVVIGLREKNFEGKIIALSPRGFEILPHRKYCPQKQILDELALPYTLENLVHLFRKHVREAQKRGESGETVVDAVRSKTQEIWQHLSLKDKQRFMTHIRHLWGVARHRIPMHVYDELQQLIKKEKLEIIAGHISDVSENGKDLTVYVQTRKAEKKSLNVNRIINCTGPQPDITKQSGILYKELLRKKILSPDEMNLGIDATPEGRIIKADGQPSDQLFVIGSLLKGKLWETTAIQELRMQASHLAGMLLK